MQQCFALFTARMDLQHFTAQLAEPLQPRAEILGKLRIDFAAQALSYGRAFAGGRDRDLQFAAAYHRTEEEIAIGNIIDAIAEDAAFHRALIDSRIHRGRIGRGNHKITTIEVCRRKFSLDPFQLAFVGKPPDFSLGLRRNHA